ncbi:MAG: ABC transporter substrate-binding protein [Tissierellia bacterium]|nr:ABC transporter substrate-binding protein [Tissierellia bacterium]
MFTGCGNTNPNKNNLSAENPVDSKSDDLNIKLDNLEGKTVNFYGWGGSQQTNSWIDGFLSDMAEEKYGIKINRVGMDIDAILNLMLGEKEAGKEDGSIDLVWINGENFFTAKNEDLLYGPFVEKVPNYEKYIDKKSMDNIIDFGYPIEGFESPYGKAQFVFIYDSAVIDQEPKDHEELLKWCKDNPGKFTYAALPDFTGSAFVRNIISDIIGYEKLMDIDPDEEEIKEIIKPAIDYLNEIKPYLWNEGRSYPADNPTLSNMYADGEISMSMSYNPNEASGKIETGEFPDTTRTFLFEKGNIGNTHFVAIPKNSPNKAAAIALVDCILSPEAQASKLDPTVWGDSPVIDFNKLNEEEKAIFDSVPIGKATLSAEELASKRIPELPADIIPIIEKIWLENVAND